MGHVVLSALLLYCRTCL